MTQPGSGAVPGPKPGTLSDVAVFLGSRPPFDAVGTDDLAHVAAMTETEAVPRGKTIFSQGAGPVEYVWVVRTGAVEIIHDGRILDLLGPGEMFGHASMISGLPTGFEARAAEDTVCYGSQNTPGRDAYAEVSPVGGACFPAAETGTRRPVRSLNTQAV